MWFTTDRGDYVISVYTTSFLLLTSSMDNILFFFKLHYPHIQTDYLNYSLNAIESVILFIVVIIIVFVIGLINFIFLCMNSEKYILNLHYITPDIWEIFILKSNCYTTMQP